MIRNDPEAKGTLQKISPKNIPSKDVSKKLPENLLKILLGALLQTLDFNYNIQNLQLYHRDPNINLFKNPICFAELKNSKWGSPGEAAGDSYYLEI